MTARQAVAILALDVAVTVALFRLGRWLGRDRDEAV